MRFKTTRNAVWLWLSLGAIAFLIINLVSFALWLPAKDTDGGNTNDPPLVKHDAQSQGSTQMAHERLLAAGFDEQTLAQHDLPTDASIAAQYGTGPILLGLDTCQTYRDTVPAEDRMLGAAGMFSTGTNLVTQLLKRNCKIPERVKLYGKDATKEQLGMRWQVRKYSCLQCL